MVMNRLFLLRHARAAWASPGMSDFDRPLDEHGRADARAMGAALAAQGFMPRRTLCSKAARAAETWELVAPAYAEPVETLPEAGLYSADAPALLDIVAAQQITGDLLVVGHNPTLEDVAAAFADTGDEDARHDLESGFPTCGFAVIELDGPFSEIRPGAGRLSFILAPADL
jgi:phosphohistidine phosphatase